MTALYDGMPVTFVVRGQVVEGRARWVPANTWNGLERGAYFYGDPDGGILWHKNEGVVWCAGWGPSAETRALAVLAALRP